VVLHDVSVRRAPALRILGRGRRVPDRLPPFPEAVMSAESKPQPAMRDLPVPLDRDLFLRTLVRELSGTLQEVVGLGDPGCRVV
jgi:hypothetical protein